MNIISLDLEMNKPSGTIIQVGAVVGSLVTGDVIETYSTCIFTEEKIDPFITDLTGIRNDDVIVGCSLYQAYNNLKDLHARYDCFRNPLTWGGGDSQELKTQLHVPDNEMFLFGRRWIDVKTVFITYQIANGLPRQAGLGKAMNKLGMEFKGTKHNAVDDAINTFRIYLKLLELIKGKDIK